MTSVVATSAPSVPSAQTRSALATALSSAPFSVGLITPLLGLMLAFAPSGPALGLIPVVVFVIIPILDALLGH